MGDFLFLQEILIQFKPISKDQRQWDCCPVYSRLQLQSCKAVPLALLDQSTKYNKDLRLFFTLVGFLAPKQIELQMETPPMPLRVAFLSQKWSNK